MAGGQGRRSLGLLLSGTVSARREGKVTLTLDTHQLTKMLLCEVAPNTKGEENRGTVAVLLAVVTEKGFRELDRGGFELGCREGVDTAAGDLVPG